MDNERALSAPPKPWDDIVIGRGAYPAPPTPEDQGFLINANRIRVSRDLREASRCWPFRGATGQHSRAPRGCEAGTEDRNRRPQTELRVEAGRYRGASEAPRPCRDATVRRPFGGGDSAGKAAPEKSR